MNKELLLKCDVIDILFEHKNKAYGAYELRKRYNARVGKALLFMMGTATVFSIFAFLPGKKTVLNKPDPYITKIYRIAEPVEPKKKTEKPVKKVDAASKPSNQFLSNIAIVRTKDPKDSIRNLVDTMAIAGTSKPGDTNGGPVIVVPVGSGTSDPVETKPVTLAVVKTGPVDNPDVMPVFPGGMDALHKFMERNLRNPQDLEEGEVKAVQVRFVVGIDGKLRSFEAEGQPDKVFYQEVVRVLKKMPEWVPGRAKGENVSVYYSMPVKFMAAE